VERIRFVRPDVAVAFIQALLLSRLGVAVDDPGRMSHVGETMHEDQARPTMVLAKDGRNWQIVALQDIRQQYQ
jgi:hypothetical protein